MSMTQKFKFKLGDKVKDQITGFTGIVTLRSQWLNGCNTYGVNSTEMKDGQPMDRHHFDEPQLIMVEKKSMIPFLKKDKESGDVVRTGGPCDNPPSSTTDT